MFYSESLTIRRPLVIATPDQLAETHVLNKVCRKIGKSLVWAVENPTLQFAVACEDTWLRTKVTGLTLGRYYTAQQSRGFGVYLATPEEGLFYRAETSGSPSGAVSTFDEDYANKLIDKGARTFDGYAMLHDPHYLANTLSSIEQMTVVSE